mmetsp:Transcript_3173/g.8107  ORF Transcript_3173/g.8107 Transcript_3173/m.8107 type:complete len:285 (+) Transcript_3173:132-986(+)
MTIILPLPSPPSSFLCGILLGASIYVISRLLSPILTARYGTPSFNKRVASLEDGRLYHYHSLLSSTIHALVQVIGTCAFVFYGRQGYDDDLPDGASPETVFDDRIFVPYGLTRLGPAVYMGIFVGYLLTDVASAPSFAVMGYPFVVHHLAASACWTFSACNRVMQPVGLLFQFNELSTLLMNVRQFLLTAGYASSDPPVLVSGLVFMLLFGLVRVAPLPFVIKDWIYRDFDAIRGKIGLGGATLLSAFFAVNASLQCGWFFIMCQRIVELLGKLLRKQPKKKAD